MDDKIGLETSQRIMSSNLRKAYGTEVGNEVRFLLPMVASSEKAVVQLLDTLSELGNKTQQLEFLNVVRQEYYKKIAQVILKKLN